MTRLPPALSRLQARVLGIAQVTPALRSDMYALYARHYDGCDPRRFAADLAAKDHVILLQDGDPVLGFSTVACTPFQATQGRVNVLFSGDTVIDRSAWGEQALTRGFAQLAGSLQAREPDVPLVWLLISKGHRTYRYLSVFARHFHPHPEQAHPGLRQLAQEIATARFGDAFDAQRGVIAFEQSHGHLAAELAEVPPHLQARPEVAFFLQRNPGYRQGEELVCLTELRADNLRSVVRAAFELGQRDGLA